MTATVLGHVCSVVVMMMLATTAIASASASLKPSTIELASNDEARQLVLSLVEALLSKDFCGFQLRPDIL